jgi:hypothetical protein
MRSVPPCVVVNQNVVMPVGYTAPFKTCAEGELNGDGKVGVYEHAALSTINVRMTVVVNRAMARSRGGVFLAIV